MAWYRARGADRILKLFFRTIADPAGAETIGLVRLIEALLMQAHRLGLAGR